MDTSRMVPLDAEDRALIRCALRDYPAERTAAEKLIEALLVRLGEEQTPPETTPLGAGDPRPEPTLLPAVIARINEMLAAYGCHNPDRRDVYIPRERFWIAVADAAGMTPDVAEARLDPVIRNTYATLRWRVRTFNAGLKGLTICFDGRTFADREADRAAGARRLSEIAGTRAPETP